VVKHTLLEKRELLAKGRVASALLYAPVPACFEAHSSLYALSCFALVH
jgi:hypothetical protein